jgi:hypothetical protein
MTVLRRSLLFVALGLVVGACAANPEGSVRGSGDIMSREEILAANRGNLYEVIEMSRPQWLRMRSEQSVTRNGGILVYMDDVRYGDLNSLRTIPARDIQQVRRYNATAASQRWGPGHSEGVIAISTRIGL